MNSKRLPRGNNLAQSGSDGWPPGYKRLPVTNGYLWLAPGIQTATCKRLPVVGPRDTNGYLFQHVGVDGTLSVSVHDACNAAHSLESFEGSWGSRIHRLILAHASRYRPFGSRCRRVPIRHALRAATVITRNATPPLPAQGLEGSKWSSHEFRRS